MRAKVCAGVGSSFVAALAGFISRKALF